MTEPSGEYNGAAWSYCSVCLLFVLKIERAAGTDGRRRADRRRENSGRRITGDGGVAAAVRIIGECTAGEAGHAGQAIGHTFDRTERRRRRPEPMSTTR